MSMMTATDRPFAQRWKEFWFSPGDPTTLGFIRIVTGLLILYAHLAYSLDLQAFFGRFGWYGTQFMERERKEFPKNVTSFWNWDESSEAKPRAPDFPHRRAAVIGYIRSLPASQSETTRSVQFLKRVASEDSYNTSLAGLQLALRLYATKDVDREKMLTIGLAQGKQYYAFDRGTGLEYDINQPPANIKSEPIFPDWMLSAPPEIREQVAAELRSFLVTLPSNAMQAQYVFNHLIELDPLHRRAFV